MKTGRTLLTLFLICTLLQAYSEGTKTIMPSSTNFGCIQFNDVGRPFALTTNTDSLHRLYFHISATSETIYFGFAKDSSSPAASGTFRIKNPSGTIVYASTTIPTSGTGFISSYSQATNGPKISGSPAGGYTPFSLVPAVTGDFYIEFASPSNLNFRFLYFDLTIANASNVIKPGRLWSYAWDMNTYAQANPFYGSFYIYSTDRFISKVNLNGIQSYGFVVSCNNTGPGSSGNILSDRKSVGTDSERPLYKIFLNLPDSINYPGASIPTITSPVSVVGGAIQFAQPVQFSVGVSSSGTIQIYISLDGVAGYQAGGVDTIIAANVIAGNNTINWNGKDARGNFPSSNTIISFTSEYATGMTHLPIWDPETNSNGGFIVNRIKPGTGLVTIRWDDSNFSGGTSNVTGGSGNGHQWAANFGNARTMNTWWDGFEYTDTNQYKTTVVSPLPIELINFSAIIRDNSTVLLSWTSASEINNDYFTIEKSKDGVNFITIDKIKGAGNSNEIVKYEATDKNPFDGISYYKLKQTDFNGKNSFSNMIIINYENKPGFNFFPNPTNGKNLLFKIKGQKGSEAIILIYDINGALRFSEHLLFDKSEVKSCPIEFHESLTKGIYMICVKLDEIKYNKTLIIN